MSGITAASTITGINQGEGGGLEKIHYGLVLNTTIYCWQHRRGIKCQHNYEDQRTNEMAQTMTGRQKMVIFGAFRVAARVL